MKIDKRVSSRAVALETTLLVHGVPAESAAAIAEELDRVIRSEGSVPALIGVVDGNVTVGMDGGQLGELLNAESVPKVNTANLGVTIHQGGHAATTVSTTMEIAAYAGLRVFATGGIGGIHHGYGTQLDISADLMALSRFPVAVVTSGVKSILDVVSTREALETLGVTVVGYQTDSFPAFYLRESAAGVDVRFDDARALAEFVRGELVRSGRGMVIANPIPVGAELGFEAWAGWLKEAEFLADQQGAHGRERTPALLGHLHKVSGGKTLEANIALIKHNARVAAQIERWL